MLSKSSTFGDFEQLVLPHQVQDADSNVTMQVLLPPGIAELEQLAAVNWIVA